MHVARLTATIQYICIAVLKKLMQLIQYMHHMHERLLQIDTAATDKIHARMRRISSTTTRYVDFAQMIVSLAMCSGVRMQWHLRMVLVSPS